MIFVVFIIGCSFCFSGDLDPEREMFEKWKLEFGVSYPSEEENEKRFMIYKENLEEVILLNESDPHAEYGETEFMDMTKEEFADIYEKPFPGILGDYVPTPEEEQLIKMEEELLLRRVCDNMPETLDWRERGLVTEVQNQNKLKNGTTAKCGSCWAFCTVVVAEGAWALASGEVVKLSEQEVIDCVPDNDDGCDGGSPEDAINWVRDNGLTSESQYPYVNKGLRKCKSDKKDVASFKGRGIYYSLPSSIDVMQCHLWRFGPLSVSFQQGPFRNYRSGIVGGVIKWKDGSTGGSVDCDKQRGHCAAIVGYDYSDNGKLYWIVKNSFGERWGEDGYFRIFAGRNKCGIESQRRYLVGST